MARAEVKISVSPKSFDLIVDALRAERETNQDMIDDPAVKIEDKQGSYERVSDINILLREMGVESIRTDGQ